MIFIHKKYDIYKYYFSVWGSRPILPCAMTVIFTHFFYVYSPFHVNKDDKITVKL